MAGRRTGAGGPPGSRLSLRRKPAARSSKRATGSRAARAPWRTSSPVRSYAEKLTLRPSEVAESDLARLREAGLDDRGILEVVQVTSYFNFVNRLADGLGVSLEHPAG
jgi:alkylhydroperoxidase family enzyme